MKSTEAKKLVIKAGRELAGAGLIERNWGNIGIRTGSNSFVITPSCRSYDTLSEEDIAEVRIDSGRYEGPLEPSTEVRMHRKIFALRPEADVVIHTHQNMASAVGSLGLDHVWFDREYEGVGSGILMAKYALPGSEALSRNIAATVEKSLGGAVIIQRHGALFFGASYEEVFDMANALETACEKYLCDLSPMLRRDMDDYGVEDGSMYLTEIDKMEGVDAILNRDKIVMDYLDMKMDLSAYLDDFAQMIGYKAPFVPNDPVKINKALRSSPAVLIDGEGVLCKGLNGEENAVSMLIRKNCLSYFAAASLGKVKKLSLRDVLLMRRSYLKRKAKRAD